MWSRGGTSGRVSLNRRARVAGLLAAGLATGALVLAAVARPVGHGVFTTGAAAAGPAAGATATASAPDDAGRTTAPGRATADAAGLAGAVVAVAQARARAFAQASAGPLAEANEPGSPAMRADVDLVRRLTESGRRLVGLSFTVHDVAPVAAPASPDPAPGSAADVRGPVTVRATVAASGHRQVGRDGAVVEVPPEPPRRVTLSLVPGPAGWRVREVL